MLRTHGFSSLLQSPRVLYLPQPLDFQLGQRIYPRITRYRCSLKLTLAKESHKNPNKTTVIEMTGYLEVCLSVQVCAMRKIIFLLLHCRFAYKLRVISVRGFGGELYSIIHPKVAEPNAILLVGCAFVW